MLNNSIIITLPLREDNRGSLTFTDWSMLPFEPKRVFWIYDVKEKMTRGGHAHATCAEVVFAVSGSFDMYVDNGKTESTYHIDTPNKGIFIDAGVWCELRNFAPGTVCVVLASTIYNPEGYINDHDEYKKIYGRG